MKQDRQRDTERKQGYRRKMTAKSATIKSAESNERELTAHVMNRTKTAEGKVKNLSLVTTKAPFGSNSGSTSELPTNWKRVRIGDTLRLVNGSAFKPTDWTTDGLPIVRIQNLNNPRASFNYTTRTLPEKFKLYGGELLFAWSGTPGTSFGAHIWRGGEAWLNQHIFNVLFNEDEWDKRFLQLSINQNLTEYIRAAHGGAGLAHITKKKFEDSELIQPPLSEQRLIVSEIEMQFTRLDDGVSALRRVQANLKRYRAAVLKAACEGKLVENEVKLRKAEGRLVESGEQLLQCTLEERKKNWVGRGKYKEPAAPDFVNLHPTAVGWTWARLDQIANVALGKMLDKTKHRAGERRLYLRNINVRWGRIDTDDCHEMFFEHHEIERYRIREGDVLVCEGGEPGRAAVWDGRADEMMYQKAIHRVRFYGRFNASFLVLLLENLAMTGKLERSFTGSTIKHFTRETFLNLAVPLPPFDEQNRIVSEVDRRLSMVDAVNELVSTNLLHASQLRRSILQSAFTGRLYQKTSL